MEGNIGLHFYRGYYHDYFGPNKILERLKGKEKEQQEEAKKMNKKFTLYKDIMYNSNIKTDAKPVSLKTVYPGLYTGSGYTFGAGLQGEFQQGFLFDYTTGLPYIPGSSVKGAIRSTFPNGAGKLKTRVPDYQNEHTNYIWNMITAKEFLANELYYTPQLTSLSSKPEITVSQIELEIFEGRDITQEKEEKYYSIYKRDIFHDAYISETVSKGATKGKFLGLDYITPHGKNPLKNPTPLPFLKILPGVTINFQFQLHDGYYLTAEGKKELFKRILLDFGIGAKTNVGYGQFSE
ncbi:type III-B CRISPR module RAMP protein Cmr6 [Bacteroidia bacterium]|nr:type III-B CRISPR module RAMP protein Cmr6 [Bacteroidia bacterium]